MGDIHAHRREIAQDSREASIRDLARRQWGHLTRAQLLEVGLTEGGIDRRLRNGALVRRFQGVYALAPAREDPPALIAAAVLAGGPTAVASHASAAFLWGFVPQFAHPLEISLPTGDRRPRHVTTHRCPSLQPRDITRQHGVPTTTPARTTLDLAPRLSHKQLTRLVNDHLRSGYLKRAALQDVIERNPLHHGTTLLAPFADDTSNPTESPFEDDFKAFLARYGLPLPVFNFPFNGRRLDAFFPEHGVIVELDGWDFHKDRDAFRDDRERDTEHLKFGLVTVRITKDRLIETPDYEAQRLQEILEGRGPGCPPTETA